MSISPKLGATPKISADARFEEKLSAFSASHTVSLFLILGTEVVIPHPP